MLNSGDTHYTIAMINGTSQKYVSEAFGDMPFIISIDDTVRVDLKSNSLEIIDIDKLDDINDDSVNSWRENFDIDNDYISIDDA